uniref:Uncharacterized protein n=1 Tax=Coccidioides posadasii RMSCC 3488 TaxID=454284 RepID=A0A0J6FJI7_COCPO|nr:hypothetical protein CPAG_05880 [Coccidioides posadasii RMSCC 3488]
MSASAAPRTRARSEELQVGWSVEEEEEEEEEEEKTGAEQPSGQIRSRSRAIHSPSGGNFETRGAGHSPNTANTRSIPPVTRQTRNSCRTRPSHQNRAAFKFFDSTDQTMTTRTKLPEPSPGCCRQRLSWHLRVVT